MNYFKWRDSLNEAAYNLENAGMEYYASILRGIHSAACIAGDWKRLYERYAHGEATISEYRAAASVFGNAILRRVRIDLYDMFPREEIAEMCDGNI